MYLITVWFGSFLYDDEADAVVSAQLFPQEKDKIATRLVSMDEGLILEEERRLAADLKAFFIADERLKGFDASAYKDDGKAQEMQKKILSLAPSYGCDDTLFHASMIAFARRKTTEAIGSKDRHLAQAVSAVEDITKSLNIMTERLNEWYGFHFPELTKKVHGEELAKLVATYGDRDTIAANVERFADSAKTSLGTTLAEGDRAMLMNYAATLMNLSKMRGNVEKHIEARMGELAPNVSYLVGSTLGAKLIKYTGSLERLATVPGSTIQLLGAEKALFRHLKEKTEPPKYGVIFQHPMVNQAKWWNRGKIARTFASKISIAAKTDYYGGEFIAETLEKQMERRIAEVNRKYPAPPKTSKQREHKKFNDRKMARRGEKRWK